MYLPSLRLVCTILISMYYLAKKERNTLTKCNKFSINRGSDVGLWD